MRAVYSLAGEWDIAAILDLAQYVQPDDARARHLRKIEGSARTQSMLAFRTYNDAVLDQGFGVGLDEGRTNGIG